MDPLGNSGTTPRSYRWPLVGFLTTIVLALVVALTNERLRAGWSPDVTPPKGAPALLRPVTIARVTEAEFMARLKGASTSALSDLRVCQRTLHRALGLLAEAPPDTPTLTGFLNAHTQLPTAAYLPGRDTIMVYFPSETAVLHEWLHALEDQRGARLARMAAATTTDERLALRTASEGFALTRSGGLQTTYRSSGDLDGAMLRASYSIGGRFFLTRPTRWDEDLGFAPHSLADVMGISEYRLTPGGLTPDGCTDRVGPIGVLTLLSMRPAERETPLRVAEHWIGDSATLHLVGGETRADWNVWMRETPVSRAFRARTEATLGRQITVHLVP